MGVDQAYSAWRFTLALLLVFLTGSVLKADAPDVPSHYQIVSFDIRLALEGSHCVNQSGVVVGTVYYPPNRSDGSQLFRGFRWEKGKLGNLNISEKELPSSSSVAINSRGQIVGTITYQPSEMMFHSWGHAFLWKHGKWQDLNTLLPDEVSHAKAINDKGEIAISAQSSSMVPMDAPEPDTQHPSYLIRQGEVIPLGNKQVVALNNKSQVLLSGNQGRYYIWEDGRTTEIGLPDIGNFTFCDMNDKLQIVGRCQKEAVLCENRHLKFLDQAHESYAQSINNKGQVVGYFYLPRVAGRNVASRAFLWQKGKLYDLDNLVSPKAGWIFDEATSINDRGQIVGRGTHRVGLMVFL